MLESRPLIIFAALLISALGVCGQEPKPAQPGPEYTFTAGVEPFKVTVHLRAAATQRVYVRAWYQRVPHVDGVDNERFMCSGYIDPGQLNSPISCPTTVETHAGVYAISGDMVLTRDGTNDSKPLKAMRLPIVTIEANPLALDEFPDVVGTSLSLTNRQSLADGSRKSQEVLNALSAHITPKTRNSKEVRSYLQRVAEDERDVLDLTRRRYISDPSKPKTPIFFEDFDRRLQGVIRELGGTPQEPVASLQAVRPHLVLVQMPSTTDSIDATEKSTTISRQLGDLVNVITDAVKGLLGMSDSGTTSFPWSATTTPPGAEIWISRLGEPETKWAGLTDVKGATLEYAIWTFRFNWGGCSKTEKPNPYLQHQVDLKVLQAGCQRR